MIRELVLEVAIAGLFFVVVAAVFAAMGWL
jgi:hypothetical protein